MANEKIGEALQMVRDDKNVNMESVARVILRSSGIRPELLARIDAILPYNHLEDMDYVKIGASFLDRHPAAKTLGNTLQLAHDLVGRNLHLKSEGVRGFIREVEEFLYVNEPYSNSP
jgi:ATP-dependent Clp protease ATP-binding subunit ClpA